MDPVLILINELSDQPGGDEADVLEQARVVKEAIIGLQYPVEEEFLGLDLEKAKKNILDKSPSLVFNLVESIGGKANLIYLAPALLDSLHIPYTGCRTESMFITSQKILTKKILQSAGIPTSRWYLPSELNQLDANITYIAKPIWEDASVGITDLSVWKGNEFSKMNRYREQWQNNFLVEEYIEGREFNLSVLTGPKGPEVLPPAEIVFRNFPHDKPKIVGYAAKWEEDTFEYKNTLRVLDFEDADRKLLDQLRKIALECWEIFGLSGYARVDFRVNERNDPFVLEVNANPCISPDAGFYAASVKAGYSFGEVIQRIMEDALQ